MASLNFREKYIVVFGTKRSGLAAAELLCRQGAKVRALDSTLPAEDEASKFRALQVEVLLQEPENLLAEGRQPDLIVLSPGVPYDLPMLARARQQGTPVIGEVELASYFLQGPTVGITGSNGKTTITALTGHLLQACGIPCQVGGNIGTAVTSMIPSSHEHTWNVLELSSFQLESIDRFRARIAVCSNVTPDHLDRHHTFESYSNAKARLFETQQVGDAAVLNFDDATCREFAKRTKANVHWFSSSQRLREGIWMQRDQIFRNDEPFMNRSQIKLLGLHNVENVMAAASVAHLAGANPNAIAAAVSSFPGVEHRIEFVRERNGVKYYNDSKATNVDATLKAVDAFEGNLWVILGGKDKGGSYAPLRKPLRAKGKSALLIGAAAPLIKRALQDALPMVDCGRLADAVSYAQAHAAPGDTVLLAPACASFDQFQSYEDRGRQFKSFVNALQ